MKKALAIVLMLASFLQLSAQEVLDKVQVSDLQPNDTLYIKDATLMEFKPTLFSLVAPWRTFGYSNWDIHRGFNASIDMGVMVGFGHYNPFKGGSFFHNISGVYAQPIGKRWTLAAGAELERYRLFSKYVNNLTVEGLASYRLNEKMSLTGFASHTFGKGLTPNNYSMIVLPYLMDNRTTVGADFGMKVNNNFSFHVGVSVSHGDMPMPPYFNENR